MGMSARSVCKPRCEQQSVDHNTYGKSWCKSFVCLSPHTGVNWAGEGQRQENHLGLLRPSTAPGLVRDPVSKD